MSTTGLYTAITTGGILDINFVNGRLLTAEDMSGLQTANAQQHQQLARAIGDGVAYGFEVSLVSSPFSNNPVVRITRGLAFNRKGQAAALSTDYVDVALVKAAEIQASSAGLFAECPPPEPLKQNTNLGLYVLTVMPTSSPQGSVTTVDLNSSGLAFGCSSRYAAEGVQFRLDPMQIIDGDPSTIRGQLAALATTLEPQLATLANLSGTAQSQFAIQIAPQLSLFRNLAAHFCFGTDSLATFPARIFPGTSGTPFPADYSALDEMRTSGLLTDCEVPLALVYWTSSGLVFLDAWAVRRPLIPSAPSAKWAPLLSPRRFAEGWAMFLQFQSQLNSVVQALANQITLGTIRADQYFRFLPPIGFLAVAATNSIGFDPSTFFIDKTHREILFVEGAKLSPLFFTSLSYPAIDLNNLEMIWLYWVRENMQAATGQASSPSPYLLFTNGHVPFQAWPQFDLNYWNFANFV